LPSKGPKKRFNTFSLYLKEGIFMLSPHTKDCSVIENDSQLITKIGENRCIFVFVFGKNYIFTFIKKLSGS
ncbi:hypothetical protein, partial [Bacillus safensis]|uniref:hypothetical protein n=1 Tax=Bacillus safensis TaxID=561879 RepID=UPI002FFFF83D